MAALASLDRTLSEATRLAGMRAQFEAQRRAFLAKPNPSATVRRDRIDRAIGALINARPRIIEAIDTDFGGRPEALTLIADVLAPLMALKDARGKVARWMKPAIRHPLAPLMLTGLKLTVQYQPLGVVGVVAPWNAPVALCFTPLAGALAAGNRVMIKPSEHAPVIASVIADMIAGAFDPEEVCVVEGGVEVSRAFVSLPFDHLLFTGGGRVASQVLHAAADNLTPVTLELGGKSPAIVARDADLAQAAAKIMGGKLANAGQICMAPDHAWVPEEKIEDFVLAARLAVRRMFPAIRGNPDYASVFGPAHKQRLRALVAEAREQGARVVEIWGGGEAPDPNIFAPTLVIDPPPSCRLATEEVFGPVLPIHGYSDLAGLVSRLNAGPTPLALYFFGCASSDKQIILSLARAGGVTINDVMLHPFMQDLPFGGLGGSGMGRYVGREGFLTFSHHKAVAERGWLDVGKFIHPPYSDLMVRTLKLATSR